MRPRRCTKERTHASRMRRGSGESVDAETREVKSTKPALRKTSGPEWSKGGLNTKRCPLSTHHRQAIAHLAVALPPQRVPMHATRLQSATAAQWNSGALHIPFACVAAAGS
jgi:hypothetical protein